MRTGDSGDHTTPGGGPEKAENDLRRRQTSNEEGNNTSREQPGNRFTRFGRHRKDTGDHPEPEETEPPRESYWRDFRYGNSEYWQERDDHRSIRSFGYAKSEYHLPGDLTRIRYDDHGVIIASLERLGELIDEKGGEIRDGVFPGAQVEGPADVVLEMVRYRVDYLIELLEDPSGISTPQMEAWMTRLSSYLRSATYSLLTDAKVPGSPWSLASPSHISSENKALLKSQEEAFASAHWSPAKQQITAISEILKMYPSPKNIPYEGGYFSISNNPHEAPAPYTKLTQLITGVIIPFNPAPYQRRIEKAANIISEKSEYNGLLRKFDNAVQEVNKRYEVLRCLVDIGHQSIISLDDLEKPAFQLRDSLTAADALQRQIEDALHIKLD